MLNSYIAIFCTTKNQNVPYNGGAKAIFFGSTATVHSYFWLCMVKKKTFYLCVHTTFDYFTHFYSFVYSYFSSSSFTLLLFVRSHFFYSFYFFVFYIAFTLLYIICAFTLLLTAKNTSAKKKTRQQNDMAINSKKLTKG